MPKRKTLKDQVKDLTTQVAELSIMLIAMQRVSGVSDTDLQAELHRMMKREPDTIQEQQETGDDNTGSDNSET